MPEFPRTLDQLRPGRPAAIAAIDRTSIDDVTVRRLHEMGFDEGVDVELLHKGPVGGDPIAVRVGNMVVALRLKVARSVAVEAIARPMAQAAE